MAAPLEEEKKARTQAHYLWNYVVLIVPHRLVDFYLRQFNLSAVASSHNHGLSQYLFLHISTTWEILPW